MRQASDIILTVQKEIESLEEGYKQKLKEKVNEIGSLTAITYEMQVEINKLRKEINNYKALVKYKNEQRQEEIDNKYSRVDNNADINIISIDGIVEPALLKELLKYESVKSKPSILITHLLQTLKNDNLEEFTQGIEISQENMELFIDKNQEMETLFELLLEEVFLNESRFEDEKYDQSIIDIQEFMILLKDSPLHLTVLTFIENSFLKLKNNILHTNYMKIIFSLFRLLYSYHLNEFLKETMVQVLGRDWDFIESDLTSDDLELLLWYSFLLDTDDKYLSKLSSKQKAKLELQTTSKIYFYMKNCLNKKIKPDSTPINYHQSQFNQNRLLSKIEKQAIMKKIQHILISLEDSRYFKWPSTEISEDALNKQDNQSELKEESELKSYGYQITGMSRIKRWEVLERAVPSLGLYKVAYTIAHHVRMRKGQKNGRRTFQHSISEWEHDLNRLKKVYYRKNFTWPKY